VWIWDPGNISNLLTQVLMPIAIMAMMLAMVMPMIRD
jgi:hypothetical protein